MREGWDIVKIGRVCCVIAGQSPKGSFYNDQGDGLPFYQGKKLFGEKFIEAPTTWTTHITKEAKAGDILLSVRAPVGPINFSTENICIGRGLAAIRVSESIDHNFLFYVLLSKQKEISGNEGAVFASINKKQIEEIEIPFPPLEEQKRIVAILDEAFAGIDTAIANTEKNLANARELFESYLNSVFARKGGDWVESTFNDVCLKIQDGAHHSPKILSGEKFDGSYLYLTSKNIRTNYMSLSKLQYTNAEFHNSIYPRCNPEYGDILLTKDGANTGNICLNTLHEPFSLLSSVCLIKTNDEIISPSFLKYYIQSQNGFKQITGKMTGAAIKRIILRTIKAAVVPYPPREKQNEIVSELDGLLSKSQELEAIYQQKLNSLKELKQSLLQKAFSGELTSKPDKLIDEAVA